MSTTHAGKQLYYKIDGKFVWVDTSYSSKYTYYAQNNTKISCNTYIEDKLQTEVKFANYYKEPYTNRSLASYGSSTLGGDTPDIELSAGIYTMMFSARNGIDGLRVFKHDNSGNSTMVFEQLYNTSAQLPKVKIWLRLIGAGGGGGGGSAYEDLFTTKGAGGGGGGGGSLIMPYILYRDTEYGFNVGSGGSGTASDAAGDGVSGGTGGDTILYQNNSKIAIAGGGKGGSGGTSGGTGPGGAGGTGGKATINYTTDTLLAACVVINGGSGGKGGSALTNYKTGASGNDAVKRGITYNDVDAIGIYTGFGGSSGDSQTNGISGGGGGGAAHPKCKAGSTNQPSVAAQYGGGGRGSTASARYGAKGGDGCCEIWCS